MVKDDNCYRRSKSAAAIMKVCVIQLNLIDAECYIFIFLFLFLFHSHIHPVKDLCVDNQ